ncbi:MAG: hypothetical protein ACHQ16_00210 [Candidatus Lutacidiplasmatales archaeon]
MSTESPPESGEYDLLDWEHVLKEGRVDILLSRDQLVEILRKLGHQFDDDGYVLDAVGARVVSIDGDEIRAADVAAALPGSEVLLKRNIASFSQYLAEHGL